MKMEYSKPFMVMEKFVAQEFVAACTIPGNYCFSSLSASNRVYLETTGDNTLNQNSGGDDYILSGAIFFDGYSTSPVTGSGGYFKFTLTPAKYKILDNGYNVTDNYHITDKGVFYRYGKKDPTRVEKNFS